MKIQYPSTVTMVETTTSEKVRKVTTVSGGTFEVPNDVVHIRFLSDGGPVAGPFVLPNGLIFN